jgi:hypothetical protein
LERRQIWIAETADLPVAATSVEPQIPSTFGLQKPAKYPVFTCFLSMKCLQTIKKTPAPNQKGNL